MMYDDFIKMMPKNYSNINLKDLIIEIDNIRKLNPTLETNRNQVILEYGLTTILLLIYICDFLEIDDIYNNLIYYIQWYIKIKYPRNIPSNKVILIYEIV